MSAPYRWPVVIPCPTNRNDGDPRKSSILPCGFIMRFIGTVDTEILEYPIKSSILRFHSQDFRPLSKILFLRLTVLQLQSIIHMRIYLGARGCTSGPANNFG